MNSFGKYFALGLVLALLIFGGYKYYESTVLPPYRPSTVVVVAHTLDSLNDIHTAQLQHVKDSILKVDSTALAKQKLITQKYKIYSRNEKERADSAEAQYNRSKSISLCDTLLSYRNAEIRAKDSVIVSIGKESIGYFQQATLYKDKYNLKCEELNSKIDYIGKLEATNNFNDCYKRWSENHKFWRWVLNIKCR